MENSSDGGNSNLVADVRGLKEAVEGLKHSQGILVGVIAIASALFVAALTWLASDISGLDSQTASLGTRIDELASTTTARANEVNARIDDVGARIDRVMENLNRLSLQSSQVEAKIDLLGVEANKGVFQGNEPEAGPPGESSVSDEVVDRDELDKYLPNYIEPAAGPTQRLIPAFKPR